MHTFPDKPIVGQPGIGQDNWGTVLNALFAAYEVAINSNQSQIINHSHDGVYAVKTHSHQADAIITPLTGTPTLDTVLSSIAGGSEVPISLADLKAWYDIQNPDLTGIEASANINSTYWGIVVVCSVSAPIFVRSWEVTVKKGESVLYQGSGAGNVFYVHDGCGFVATDELSVRVKLYTGTNDSVTSLWYTHTYNPPTNPEISAMQAQLDGLTIPNIVSAFKDDEAAMTALANILQGSNLLANKVSSLMSQS
jgi:hypothetical protein